MSHQEKTGDDFGPDVQTPAHPGTDHETTDISLRPLILFVLGLVGSLILVLVVLRAQFAFYEGGQSEGQLTPIPRPLPALTDGPPVEPRLQETPELDMDAVRAIDDAKLTRTGWVDRTKGTAEISIDDAMKIVVQKGLPVRKQAAPPEGEKPPGTRTGRPTEATTKGAP
jgi:hypothetical protein